MLIEYYAWYCDTYSVTVLYPVSDFKQTVLAYDVARNLVGCNRDPASSGLCPLGFGQKTDTVVCLDDGKMDKKVDRTEWLLE